MIQVQAGYKPGYKNEQKKAPGAYKPGMPGYYMILNTKSAKNVK